MNQLASESSPYLLQHANNPVHWLPWSEAAFEQARRENKPVLVSIGYAACHWCHVMEKESFEDPEVAAYMNAHFINIKVDREERPDVDHLYMDALQVMNGQGGWPLNMFVTPARKPFYGGTYFPPKRVYQRASWMEVLESVRMVWAQKNEEVIQQSEQLVQHLAQVNLQETVKAALPVSQDSFEVSVKNLLLQGDAVNGGFGMAPKFPQTMSIQFLLHYFTVSKDASSLDQALLSLDKMLSGGIYDQIGGGLSRYATDSEWLIPHFEKMLYDNALLIEVLSEAYAITKKERYRSAILEIVAFLDRELKCEKTGAYFAALDADSEGEEGRFYVWQKDELAVVLGDSLLRKMESHWDISEHGNWEDNIILSHGHLSAGVAEKQEADPEFIQALSQAKQLLLAERNKRVRPQTDTKILLGWNALLVKGLASAGTLLNDESLILKAELLFAFLVANFKVGNDWFRSFDGAQVKIQATLEDIAYLISAGNALVLANGNYQWLHWVKNLQEYADERFLSEDRTFYYFSDVNQTDIVVRKVETYDGALPSVNAVMAENCMYLSRWCGNDELHTRCQKMIESMRAKAQRYPSSFAYWNMVHLKNEMLQTLVYKSQLTVLELANVNPYFSPHLMLIKTGEHQETLFNLLKDNNENLTIYYAYCSKNACMSPTTDINSLFRKIKLEKVLD